MSADAEIADPHLAQRAIEIGEDSVEQTLAEPARPGPVVLEPMKTEKRMKTNQLKATVYCVRHTVIREENGLAGLLDDAVIREVYGLTSRIASGEREHGIRSQLPQTLTTNCPRLNLSSRKMGPAPTSFNRTPVA